MRRGEQVGCVRHEPHALCSHRRSVADDDDAAFIAVGPLLSGASEGGPSMIALPRPPAATRKIGPPGMPRLARLKMKSIPMWGREMLEMAIGLESPSVGMAPPRATKASARTAKAWGRVMVELQW